MRTALSCSNVQLAFDTEARKIQENVDKKVKVFSSCYVKALFFLSSVVLKLSVDLSCNTQFPNMSKDTKLTGG